VSRSILLDEVPRAHLSSVVRLPPSRPLGALASLAEAFGEGGKPDSTYGRGIQGILDALTLRHLHGAGAVVPGRDLACEGDRRPPR
jgi:hypothetical protein